MSIHYKLQLGLTPPDGSERKAIAVLKTEENGNQWSIPFVEIGRAHV